MSRASGRPGERGPADQGRDRCHRCGLAGIAAAISYSHMRLLAQDNGQAGWHAHAFPLSVDGIEVVASLVLLADRRAARRPGWLPWAALAVGTAGSLAANVAIAGPGTVGRVIAGWPALALLIAVKLLSGMLDQHTAARPATIPTGTARDRHDRDRPPPAAMSVPSRMRVTRPQAGPSTNAAERRTGLAADAEPGPARTLPAGADLLAAARATRDALQQDGRHLTRDVLAARLRENGHPVSNSRLTSLLQTLRCDPASPPPSPPASTYLATFAPGVATAELATPIPATRSAASARA
ncbi:MAG TPA: DUF2637 domain-containing protein [Streptosporangiaceae bacterium]|nr:DUF2637 domain-containing protein [Streptosporangiaceae bacterium]